MKLRDPETCPRLTSILCSRPAAVVALDCTVLVMVTHPGVYFVECAGFIKIGKSWHVLHRLASLRPGCPLPMEPLGFIPEPDEDRCSVTEAELHDRFVSSRARGEWFRDTLELRRFICIHAQPWPALEKRGHKKETERNA